MWTWIESIIVLVVIGVAAALLACRAKKKLDGDDSCACGNDVCCAKSLDSLSEEDESKDAEPAQNADEK